MSNTQKTRPPAKRGSSSNGTAAAKKRAASNGTASGAAASGGYSLAAYRAEATGEPFVLHVDDTYVIEIPRPTGNTLMTIGERFADVDPNDPTGVNPRDVLQLLLGEKYDEVMDVLGGEDIQVLVAFIRDLSAHFQLGEALASLS